MKGLKFKENIIMIIVISFIGFCFEDLWMLFRYSLIDNRNMYLPFLLGYGLFIVAIYYMIGVPKKLFNKYELSVPISYVIYIVLSFILVSIGEILLGTFVEKTGHFYYWNYSSIPMHFTRYTSVPTSIGFALAITLFMNYIYIPLENKMKKISKKIPTFIVLFVFIILIIDLNISFKNMCLNDGSNSIWTININK